MKIILMSFISLVLFGCEEPLSKSSFSLAMPPTITIYEHQSSVLSLAVEGSVSEDEIEFSISGTDQHVFSIDDTSLLSFNIETDRDSPADADADNIYQITITAKSTAGNSESVGLEVTVVEQTQMLIGNSDAAVANEPIKVPKAETAKEIEDLDSIVEVALTVPVDAQIEEGGQERAVVQIDSSPSTPSRSTESVLYIAIVALSLATLISVSISFYLYKWRKILLANKNVAMPETWVGEIIELRKYTLKMTDLFGENLGRVVLEAKNNTVKIDNMTDTYMELHSALDDKDEEIKRLKSGYDAEIFRRFIGRFARIDQAVEDYLREEDGVESLTQIRRLLEDAFDECGVSKFEPEIGEDYRRVDGIVDNPKTEATTDSSKEFLISEVLEAGYRLDTGSDKQVIIPSKVRIFRMEGNA